MKDFKLTSDGDLAIESNDFLFVEDEEQIRQFLKIKLKTFFGECAFNTDKGVKYFEEIFIKEPNKSTVDGIIKGTIIDTDGVLEIIEYSSEISRENREVSIDTNIRTVFGDITFVEVL